jgi:glycosyltransferase involved in cell wall biosynthesis
LDSGLNDSYRIIHVRTNVNQSNRGKGRLNLSKLAALGSLWARLIAKVTRYRPRLVYLFLSQNRSGFWRDTGLILTARLARARVIAQVHGANFGNFYHHSGATLRRIIRLVVGQTSMVLLSAERFREQFKDLVPAKNVRVLHNAVDWRLFEEAGPRRSRADSAVKILFVGHLSAAKGFPDVLRASSRVFAEVPKSTFTFVGEWLKIERNILYDEAGRPLKHSGSEMEILWRELKHRYQDRLQHLQGLAKNGMVTLMKTADIFVLPSYSEAFPVVVLEAMAAGLPLVVTPVGALPEVLEEGVNGIFVAPGDSDAIAKALIELAQRPDLREEMGRANMELVRKRFSPEAITRQLAALFQECLA